MARSTRTSETDTSAMSVSNRAPYIAKRACWRGSLPGIRERRNARAGQYLANHDHRFNAAGGSMPRPTGPGGRPRIRLDVLQGEGEIGDNRQQPTAGPVVFANSPRRPAAAISRSSRSLRDAGADLRESPN